jgi:hypothetical protein
MRTLLIAALTTLVVCPALAEPTPQRPVTPAPAANASAEARNAWCTDYAAWFVAHTPDPAPAPEARATQRFETERNSCLGDPQAYERQTIAEMARITQST